MTYDEEIKQRTRAIAVIESMLTTKRRELADHRAHGRKLVADAVKQTNDAALRAVIPNYFRLGGRR